MGRSYSILQFKKAQRLYGKGLNASEVAKAVGVDPRTALNWIKDYFLPIKECEELKSKKKST